MKTYRAQVYVKSGASKLPHTVQVQATSAFSAQQMLQAQYGRENVLTIPTEVTGGSNKNAPWMLDI